MTERTGQGPATAEAVAGLRHEIKLLIDMIVEHAAPWLDGIIAAGHGWNDHDTDDHQEDAADRRGASCGWCPLCAVVNVARGERPELSTRAFEQTAQLVALLRAVLADRWYPGEGVHMPGFEPEPSTYHAARSDNGADNGRDPGPQNGGPTGARVQRIAVRRSTGSAPEPAVVGESG
ncbi:MAG: hypothetical protein GEU86_11005 [Actinophytocola sp.]|nr:hypothetical protein [Actinophytocola sp.]